MATLGTVYTLRRILIFFFVLSNEQALVRMDFVQFPRNTCATYGSAVKLECSLEDDVLQFWKNPSGVTITENGHVLEEYEHKYTIQGKYTLVILNVTYGDAGTYECVDSTAHDDPRTAELVILGNNLRVTSNVSNNLLLEGESVKFRCDIHHSGNIMPVIKWGSSGEVIPATTVRNIELIQSDIIFLGEQNTNGKELECSVFFEEIQTSETGVATNAPNCSLSPITQNIIVHYKPTNTMISHVNGSKISSGENANADDVLVCSTNSNPPARKYTWMTGDIVANEKTFTFPHSFNGFTSLQCSVKNYMGENRIIEGTDSVTIHVNVLATENGGHENGERKTVDGQDSSSDNRQGLTGGEIAGIVIGSIVAFGVCIVLPIVFCVHSTLKGYTSGSQTREATDSSGNQIRERNVFRHFGQPANSKRQNFQAISST